jgi:RNA polymerase sigma-70 factor, ECF subfamily
MNSAQQRLPVAGVGLAGTAGDGPRTLRDTIARTMTPSTADTGGDERALLLGLRSGDEGAYRRMVCEYGGRMLAVSRRFMRNEEDARDAVQDAFLQAFRGLPAFGGQSALGTWLHKIVVNACLMRLRRAKSRPEEPIEPLLPRFLNDGHPASPAVQWPEPCDRLAERSEVRDLVRASIGRLPERYRTVLLLRDIEEMDTAAAAAALGVTENAVKVRLHRARQALRELLDPALRKGFA